MAFRQRLHDGDLLVGTMLSEVRNPNVALMLATAGLDWVVIDLEHGTYGWPDVAALVTACRDAGVAPLVRIPEVRRETVLKPLDAGAVGLVVPMVEHPEQVAEVVRHAKYPPEGRRGVALRRAHSRYAKQSPVAAMAQANEQTVLLMQIESQAGVDGLADLCAVPGFDGFFIGPFDLSVDLGIPGELGHDRLWAAYEQVIATARAHGLAPAIQMFDHDMAERLLAMGVRLCSFSSDVNTLVDSWTESARRIRAR